MEVQLFTADLASRFQTEVIQRVCAASGFFYGTQAPMLVRRAIARLRLRLQHSSVRTSTDTKRIRLTSICGSRAVIFLYDDIHTSHCLCVTRAQHRLTSALADLETRAIHEGRQELASATTAFGEVSQYSLGFLKTESLGKMPSAGRRDQALRSKSTVRGWSQSCAQQ